MKSSVPSQKEPGAGPASARARSASMPDLALQSEDPRSAQVNRTMAMVDASPRVARTSATRQRVQSSASMVAQRVAVSVDDYRGRMDGKTGNFHLGEVTSNTKANKIGADWVGKPTISKISLSDDGLHQYRKPTLKPKLGKVQANVEARDVAQGSWTANGHITVEPETT